MHDHIDLDKCKVLFSSLARSVDHLKKEDGEKALLRERIKKIKRWNPDEVLTTELKNLSAEVDQTLSRQKVIVERQLSEQKIHEKLCAKVAELEQKIHDFLERSSQKIPAQKALLVSRKEKIKSLRASVVKLEQLYRHIKAEKQHHPHQLKKISETIKQLKKRIGKIGI